MAHADIRIQSRQGQALLTAKTYQNGAFDLLTQTQPQSFQAIAQGTWQGEQVTLRATVANNTGQFVRLNLLTSLVTAYLDRHPDQTEGQAEVAIRRVLRLPSGLNLSRPVSTKLFNPTVFVMQAKQVGGINRFIEQVAADAGSSKTYSFKTVTPTFQTQGLTDGVLGFLLSNAAKGVGSGVFSFIVKQVSTAVTGQQDAAGQLQAISTQLTEIDGKLTLLSSDLNDLQTSVNQGLQQIKEDTNFNDFNTIYDTGLLPMISKNQSALDMLEGIVKSAEADTPNTAALQYKLNKFYTFIDTNYDIKQPTQATYNIGHWKDLLISNGIGTRGVLQAWSHYVAAKQNLYNQVSAQDVQSQWDFLDAQWLLYTTLVMGGLEHHQRLDTLVRQDILTTWAKSRQTTVLALRGGNKSANQLNAGLYFSDAQDASINALISQSVPTPLPTNMILNQLDQSMWWTVPAYTDQIGHQISNDLEAGPVDYRPQALANVQAAVGGSGWIIPGFQAYTSLQQALNSMNQSFEAVGFTAHDPTGNTNIIVPLTDVEYYSVPDEPSTNTFRDGIVSDSKYIFDPSNFTRAFGFVSSDPNFNGDSDNLAGCPSDIPSWNSVNTTASVGGIYYLSYAATYDYGFFKDHIYHQGIHVRNRDFVGCSANVSDSYNKALAAVWALYAQRPLAVGETYTY